MSNQPLRTFENWAEQKSSAGKIYYYNKQTEVSQWEKPPEWKEHDAKMEQERMFGDKSKYGGSSAPAPIPPPCMPPHQLGYLPIPPPMMGFPMQFHHQGFAPAPPFFPPAPSSQSIFPPPPPPVKPGPQAHSQFPAMIPPPPGLVTPRTTNSVPPPPPPYSHHSQISDHRYTPVHDSHTPSSSSVVPPPPPPSDHMMNNSYSNGNRGPMSPINNKEMPRKKPSEDVTSRKPSTSLEQQSKTNGEDVNIGARVDQRFPIEMTQKYDEKEATNLMKTLGLLDDDFRKELKNLTREGLSLEAQYRSNVITAICAMSMGIMQKSEVNRAEGRLKYIEKTISEIERLADEENSRVAEPNNEAFSQVSSGAPITATARRSMSTATSNNL
ncbi:unnamed protein product [Caenorhabditis bovis]|uniref:WW domain-containing protein n=1 Tax=Caenorhabditis bovis TaxID=2654633 RepID=A0A8S1EW78_9PELO|nr:unnamed protein product [Caenorhabditis bovis]